MMTRFILTICLWVTHNRGCLAGIYEARNLSNC
uniref:Uncharacterized protein n=1 Tax=Utricularia reniformis TaxID=192314 RepID=A0A1Y0B484_9LAMI|nr:hypothetical protein AEK19_MT2039 [Utricularia reniformis]ART32197.1 hypothetical protein AEK19_MT2039 [Utricularia reniformis]